MTGVGGGGGITIQCGKMAGTRHVTDLTYLHLTLVACGKLSELESAQLAAQPLSSGWTKHAHPPWEL